MCAPWFGGGVLAAALLCGTVSAQTAAPVSDARPATVKVGKSEIGALYTDAHGRTLYSYNTRVARSRTGTTLTYCVGPCLQRWTPLAAPANAVPLGDWTMVSGVQGSQWAYRGNPVFTLQADRLAGAIGGDGEDEIWTALRYVPPAPKLDAPALVVPRYVDGRYVLSDPAGRRLFVAADARTADASWTPLLAGMAARGVGGWTIDRAATRPQWAYRGKPVFVAPEETPDAVPAGGVALQA